MATGHPISIGWDVGGWNCDRNANSRDAIVVLGKNQTVLGKPWRGNLANHILNSPSSEAFIAGLFRLCGTQQEDPSAPVVLAIDAPLGFPSALLDLLHTGRPSSVAGGSADNPYLFRLTERLIAQSGNPPLSVVKDMIGSQSTKAIHAVRLFFPQEVGIGVWGNSERLTAIETYPAACRRAQPDLEKNLAIPDSAHGDVRDAGVCAVIGMWFSTCRKRLNPPPIECPKQEGWIWLPYQKDKG